MARLFFFSSSIFFPSLRSSFPTVPNYFPRGYVAVALIYRRALDVAYSSLGDAEREKKEKAEKNGGKKKGGKKGVLPNTDVNAGINRGQFNCEIRDLLLGYRCESAVSERGTTDAGFVRYIPVGGEPV